jgi:tRNA-Thr(GGU) m(6)t(6)A37 methyltransferase TsaA
VTKTITFLGIAVAAFVAGGFTGWLVSAGKGQTPGPQAQEIRDSGGREVTKPREFLIEGMTCQGCVDHLTSALTEIPGVESAKVSLAEKKAVLVAGESQVPSERILAAIRKAGFQGRASREEKCPAMAAGEPKQTDPVAGKSIVMQPIGIVHSPYREAKGTPIQGVFDKGSEAWVELNPEFVRGLTDLDGFSHAILLYQFHLSDKVEIVGKPYLENEEHGVFATRSPNRPNHLGLSVVKIKRIDGNRLYFVEVDVLDGTPVLDIKPYVKQFDCRHDAVSGWIERHFKDGKQPENTVAK